jgi:hypothetical protein
MFLSEGPEYEATGPWRGADQRPSCGIIRLVFDNWASRETEEGGPHGGKGNITVGRKESIYPGEFGGFHTKIR